MTILIDGKVGRGCLKDLTNEDRALCLQDDYKSCKVCTDDDCNDESFNSSSKMLTNGFLIATLVFFVSY